MLWAKDELEAYPCDYCGNSETRLVFGRQDGLNAVECRSCGLCFINPRPRSELLRRLYDKDYFASKTRASSVGYQDYFSDISRRDFLASCRIRLDVLRKHTGPIRGMRMLEMGCATGEMCYRAHLEGCVSAGYDVNETAIEEAKRRYPSLDFRIGDANAIPGNETYDLILAFEVIEHVASPMRFLKVLRGHMADGGYLALSTPNYNCARALGPSAWDGFSHSFEHLYFLTPETLALYAGKVGLALSGWYGGGGTGKTALARPQWAGAARRAAADLGLLRFAKKMRGVLAHARPHYKLRDNQHNLLAVLKLERSGEAA